MSTSVLAPPPPAPGVPPAPPDPGPDAQLNAPADGLRRAITAVIVVLPLVALVVGIIRLWGHGVGLRDLLIAAVLYCVTGMGVTIGYHRLLAHRGFKAARPLRLVLAVAGSLAFEGSVIGWVANHRRHHAFTDRPGDPHSPHDYGPGFGSQLRGLWHAHMGWLFEAGPPDLYERYARDLVADPALVRIERLFPLWCAVSLLIPFGLGWALTGSVGAGLVTLVWAGGVRVLLLHHVTWSINSVCHMFGRRPFDTRDRSTNFAPLALLSFGESWHNAHHAHPSWARHGVGRHQLDVSAGVIRLFERAGWVRDVRWPSARDG